MKPGDKVKTFQGEFGVIEKPWTGDGNEYQWWVTLPIANSIHKTCIPYRDSELTLVSGDEQAATEPAVS